MHEHVPAANNRNAAGTLELPVSTAFAAAEFTIKAESDGGVTNGEGVGTVQTREKNKKAGAYCTPRELRRSESLDSNSLRPPAAF